MRCCACATTSRWLAELHLGSPCPGLSCTVVGAPTTCLALAWSSAAGSCIYVRALARYASLGVSRERALVRPSWMGSRLGVLLLTALHSPQSIRIIQIRYKDTPPSGAGFQSRCMLDNEGGCRRKHAVPATGSMRALIVEPVCETESIGSRTTRHHAPVTTQPERKLGVVCGSAC